MLSAPGSPKLITVVVKNTLKKPIQAISSALSEVFDWSALEMLSTPESPSLFPVV